VSRFKRLACNSYSIAQACRNFWDASTNICALSSSRSCVSGRRIRISKPTTVASCSNVTARFFRNFPGLSTVTRTRLSAAPPESGGKDRQSACQSGSDFPSKIRRRNIQSSRIFFDEWMALYLPTEIEDRCSAAGLPTNSMQHQMRHTDRTTPELCKVLHIEKKCRVFTGRNRLITKELVFEVGIVTWPRTCYSPRGS
jgi:hypothetical protein